MTTSVEHYNALLEDGAFDSESLTIFVVAGTTQEHVAQVLKVDLSVDPVADPDAVEDFDGVDVAAYYLTDIPGGVLAIEPTGYADPNLDAMRQVTTGGAKAAVVRGNIQAHYR